MNATKSKNEVLCGGYVSYDTRKKDDWGFPIRTEIEVYVKMPAEGYYDDCGYWTNLLVKALEAKVAKKFKTNRNVECRECWKV